MYQSLLSQIKLDAEIKSIGVLDIITQRGLFDQYEKLFKSILVFQSFNDFAYLFHSEDESKNPFSQNALVSLQRVNPTLKSTIEPLIKLRSSYQTSEVNDYFKILEEKFISNEVTDLVMLSLKKINHHIIVIYEPHGKKKWRSVDLNHFYLAEDDELCDNETLQHRVNLFFRNNNINNFDSIFYISKTGKSFAIQAAIREWCEHPIIVKMHQITREKAAQLDASLLVHFT